MQLTPNLKLKKPEASDAVNIEDLNGNTDVLDAEVTKLASTTDAGRMSAADKVKLNGIAAGAQVNPGAATTSAAGLMSAADKSKLDGVATGANNYTHPSSHPASIITQDSSNRFVTDAEKAAWNAKAGTAVATGSANGLMPAADKAALNAATNAATASTLVKRDSAGRMKAAAPASSDDVARKAETDAALTTANNAATAASNAQAMANSALPISGGAMTGIVHTKPSTGPIGSATASNQEGISVQASGVNNAAFMSFLRSGIYAGYFGIDTDNKLKFGGWSMGNNAYELWHDGRLRVNAGRLEFLDGGVWKSVGANQVAMPSDNVQYQDMTTRNFPSSSDFIVAKLITKCAGLIRVKLEVQTNATLYINWLSLNYSGSETSTSTASVGVLGSYGWDTPLGSAITSSGLWRYLTVVRPGGYGSPIGNGTWQSYVFEVSISNTLPYLLTVNSTSGVNVRNVQVCYDVITP